MKLTEVRKGQLGRQDRSATFCSGLIVVDGTGVLNSHPGQITL